MSYPTPRDRKFGAKGGGADDTVALKKWLDYIAGKAGTLDRWYHSSQTLYLHPGTTIYGVGQDNSGFAAHQSHAGAEVLVYGQSGCRFFDLGLRGTPALREVRHSTMLRTDGDDIVLHNCALSWWRTLFMPVATNRLQVTNCDFGHWADSITLPERDSPEGRALIAANAAWNATVHTDDRTPEWSLPLRGQCVDDGGYALLGGNGSWPNHDVTVLGCTFHDGRWTAIDCLQPNVGCRWSIIDTTISRVHECGIYCGVEAIIDRVTILDVKRRDCSAHGIEGGGKGTRLTHSVIGRTDGHPLLLTNPVNFYAGHNTFFDPMEEAPANADVTPWAAAIYARNTAAPAELLADGLLIERNDIANERGKASYVMHLSDWGGGPFHGVTFDGTNRLHGPWKGGVLSEGPGVRGRKFNVIKSAEAIL